MQKIGIIVPVYNVEKTLSRCIESILNQTFENFKLILINDGSLDRSGEICEEYRKMDSRITVIHKKNGGLSSARNAGIDIVDTEYIGFVDSDDFIDKDMYNTLYQAIIREEADISSCDFLQCEEGEMDDLSKINKEEAVYLTYQGKDSVKQLLRDKEINRSAWNKLYKSELFENIRYPVGKLYEDTYTTYKLYLLAKRVVHTNYKGYYYMFNPNSITREAFSPKHFDVITETKRVLCDLQNNRPDLCEYEYGRLAKQYVGLVVKIFDSLNNKKNKVYLDKIMEDIKQDFVYFRHNKTLDKKYKIVIFILYYNPSLFFLIYKLARSCKSYIN